jgi:multiple sugar transport system permease protein
MTLAVGLRLFMSYYRTEWNLMMAAATLTVIPVLILFFSAQRYFLRGVAMSGFGGR